MNRSSNKSYRHSANYARHMPHMNGAYGMSDMNNVNRMTRDITDIPIGRRLDELVNELQYVSDPVERIILTNLIRIKQKQNVIMEQRTGKTGDTESLDSLSGDEIYDVDSIDTSTDDVGKPGHEAKYKAKHKAKHKAKRANRGFKRSDRSNTELEELELSEKTRMNSLKEIKKKELQKLREEAYQEMLVSEMDTDDEGGEGSHNDEDIDDRRDEETDESDDIRWGATIKDPRYDNYVREDKLNNKMMERLNTEIDFRTEARSSEIIKPFDDADGMMEEQHQQYQHRGSRRRRG